MSDLVLDAYLTVIGRDGWAAARIDAVAEVAGVSTATVAGAFADRWAALRAYGRRLDRAALGEAGGDRDASVRDRLFAMLMERFDTAQHHRPAVVALVDAARRDPGLAAYLLLALPASVARLADAAGVPTGGWLGPLRVQALTALYLAVGRVWLDDDSPDLGSTMKALDERLTQAETWARRLPHREVVRPAEVPRLTDGRPAG